MMVRTIQHPGVEIQESEIGGYRSTVVMNNAYIMGFTDKGPIYDYSFITTTKEFTKIYGEPQTEAEKYVFIAVQSVLANGGTPIIARMPYDNKQCKAYKALKMKWIDRTDMISPKIDTDLASPLIPLSTITDGIDKNKSFKDIFDPAQITINNIPMADTPDVVNNISVLQAVELLNPYKSGSPASDGVTYDEIQDLLTLKINGVSPSSLNIDQNAIESIVNSLKDDDIPAEIYVSRYDAGYNKEVVPSTEIDSHFLGSASDNTVLSTFCNKYLKVNDNYLISLFQQIEPDTELSGYKVINVDKLSTMRNGEYKDLTTLTGLSEASGAYCFLTGYLVEPTKPSKYGKIEFNGFGEDTRGYLSGIPSAGMSGELIPGVKPFIDAIIGISNKPFNISGNLKRLEILDGEPIGYFDSNVAASANYIITPTYDGVKLYNIYDINDEDKNYDAIKVLQNLRLLESTSSYLSGDATVSAILTSDYQQFKNTVNSENYTELFGKVDSADVKAFDGYATGDKPGIEATIKIDKLIPIFENTFNGIITGSVDKMTFEKLADEAKTEANRHTLKGFVNLSVENPVIEGRVLSSDMDPDYFNKIPENDQAESYEVWNQDNPAVTGYFDKSKKTGPYAYKFETYADELLTYGGVTFTKYYAVAYKAKVNTMSIRSVTSAVLEKNEFLAQLNAIYNDPAFLNLADENNYTLLESKLLATPEMGFKIGLYLDSEDCEISNDQYDDLVTVNQFKAVDRTIDKYGQDIDDANFIIVDKQKSVVQGVGGNIGFFTAIIDPFDALKVQRTLVSPDPIDPSTRKVGSQRYFFDHSDANIRNLDYWAYQSQDAWNTIYDDILNSMDCLQRVRNADGIYVGEPNPIDGKLNILDSWSIPLTGSYYDDSVSKTLMRKFPAIAMADVTAEDLENPEYIPSIIDHQYATHICVAVCKTSVDQSNGRIAVNLVETFFGSLFAEKNSQNGRSLFIGDIINANSDYIEFFRNDYVSAGDKGAYDPPEYRRSDVNQIFIKDSDELRNAAAMRGIDYEDYGCDALDPAIKAEHEAQYYNDLHKYHIWEINKQDVCIYNLHWEANFTSFSKKESQKVIANTVGLYSVNDGTTENIARNFLVDMDRCIKFIKNIDEIPLHFICDAGLSTIAQFCDNVVWNPKKKSVVGEETDPITGRKTGVKLYEQTGGWITQPFDPDNDPDGEDRYITGYEDVSTWRRVVEKTISIASDIRKDCFVIIDAPRHLTLDGAAPKIRRSKFTNNFDKTIGRALRYISGINTSYAAGYYNWLRTTDVYSGRSIWIPPTTKIIGNYCYLNISNLPWLAPAGLTYGLISGCHAVSHNPDAQEEDQIYMKSWNYIKQYPFDGLVVEGQRTLLGKESVFERINVRLLFLDLERYAYNVSRQFKYQVNNAYTREQFVATLKPKFEDYALRGGIYEYLIKVDEENNTPETIDANELRGDIFIKPARLIEFVLLSFIGTSTSTDFSELSLNY